MPTLKFSHSGEEIELQNGSPIAEACEEAGVPFACTEGVCGTCVVEVEEGQENLSKPTQEEEDVHREKWRVIELRSENEFSEQLRKTA